jgi:hypothetical protein
MASTNLGGLRWAGLALVPMLGFTSSILPIRKLEGPTSSLRKHVELLLFAIATTPTCSAIESVLVAPNEDSGLYDITPGLQAFPFYRRALLASLALVAGAFDHVVRIRPCCKLLL